MCLGNLEGEVQPANSKKAKWPLGALSGTWKPFPLWESLSPEVGSQRPPSTALAHSQFCTLIARKTPHSKFLPWGKCNSGKQGWHWPAGSAHTMGQLPSANLSRLLSWESSGQNFLKTF